MLWLGLFTSYTNIQWCIYEKIQRIQYKQHYFEVHYCDVLLPFLILLFITFSILIFHYFYLIFNVIYFCHAKLNFQNLCCKIICFVKSLQNVMQPC